jgi:putative colanic acid biosynthesis acetyltransferase WcaF
MASQIHYLSPRSLSRMNKITRLVWGLVWMALFRPTPRGFHIWRVTLLRLFGAKMGRAVHVYPSTRIWAPWNLEMGDHSCLSERVDCYSVDKIKLGAHATVSQYSFLCTASRDYTDSRLRLVSGPIVIGDHAWVTADVFVAPGVSIGEGAVITARSSVFSDIESWVVATGNPARKIRTRTPFSERTR